MLVHGKYFYGNEISEYGQEMGFVDYKTLAKAFDAVSSDIMQKTDGVLGWWEQISGGIDNSEEIEALEDQIEELIENDGDAEKIQALRDEIEELEEEQDESYNEDIFQFFIVSRSGAEILQKCGEIVFYNDALDLYVWGVTHCGTSWDYVLTNIPCNVPYEDEE